MKYQRDVLEAEFRLVDDNLPDPVPVYLIGGGAMSLQELKVATKDIDVVLESKEALAQLEAALRAADYGVVHDLDRAYRDLAATRIYTKTNAPQWDLFVQVVCRKLRLSPGMKGRAPRVAFAGKRLRVHILAPEDIFVFKAITERRADEVDVDALFAHGLDWDVVLDEMRWQSRNSDRAWATYFLATLQRLQARGAQLPIVEAVERLDEEERDEWAVLTVLEKPRTPGQVVETLQAHEDEDLQVPVLAAVERLVAHGRLLREGKLIRKNPDWTPE